MKPAISAAAVVHAEVRTALEAVQGELRQLHQRIAPYPRSGCGLAERNLTHAFASALRACRPTLSVLHEMALGGAVAGDARLDTVVFDDELVVLVEAKGLYGLKSLTALGADWIRLQAIASQAFAAYCLPSPRRMLVRLVLGDVWDLGAQEDGARFLSWLRQRSAGVAVTGEPRWEAAAAWWTTEPAADHAVLAEVIRVDEVPEPLRTRWTTSRAYHLWAAWRLDGAGAS